MQFRQLAAVPHSQDVV